MATRADIRQKVVDTLAEALGKEAAELEAHADAPLSDLGVTSVQTFVLIGELEDAYGLDIDYSEFITRGQTLASCVDYVTEIAAA